MRNPFAIVLISVLFHQSIFAQRNIHPDEATVAQLKKFRNDFIESMKASKPDIIYGYYGSDIRLMTETQKTIMGTENAVKYHNAFHQRFRVIQYTREEFEILDLGGRIVECGLFTEKLKIKTSGKESEIRGKYVNIWERSSDGKLLLITEAWNYNHQVDIADQLVFPDVPSVNVSMQGHSQVKDNISFELAALNHYQESVITARDATLWSQFYADDYILFRIGNPLFRGKREFQGWLEAHVKELPVFEKLDIRNDRIDNLGEYVIEYASHIAIVRNGDWSGVSTGKDIRIWRRERDGALKIIRGIGMYD